MRCSIADAHHPLLSRAKADVAKYIAADPEFPATIFENYNYYENISNPAFGLLTRKNGLIVLDFGLPSDTPITMYSVQQTGAWILQAFKHPEEWIGKLQLAQLNEIHVLQERRCSQ
jgi:hypothetical protein